MDDKSELSGIANLLTPGSTPGASVLRPEVRSGASFTFAAGTSTIPAFLLVWFYTVDDAAVFATAVHNLEQAGVMNAAGNPPPAGVEYRGTYSVTISSPAPQLDFRTVWGLADLGKLKDLNDFLRSASPLLRNMLDLISRRTVMHSEIMGLTRLAAPI